MKVPYIDKKVPFYVIVIVIILILIGIVVIASYTSKEDGSTKSKLYLSKKSADLNRKDIYVHPVKPYHQIDSFVFEIDSLRPEESYILGGPMQDSTVSIYSNENLIYTKVFSGNHGFVITKNNQLVNASYFQIGKKFELENIKYHCIPILENEDNLKIAVNNLTNHELKIYKCEFNYSIFTNFFTSRKNVESIGLSEYDLDKLIRSKYNVKEKAVLIRIKSKTERTNWTFSGKGKFLLVYVKGLYDFKIKDSNNKLLIQENKNINNLNQIKTDSIEAIELNDPELVIENLNETIPIKSLNSDLLNLMKTPISLFNHFVKGKNRKLIDIWNQINNKIFVYKV